MWPINFASESGIHISLRAEPIIKMGFFTLTNSILYGAICSILIAFILIWSAKHINISPKKGFAQIIEMLVEFSLTMMEGVFGTRAKAVKFAPIFTIYFLFIVFSNIFGLIPIVGTSLTTGGTPLLRPFTADLNGTVALSIIAIIMVQVLSIKEQGTKKHLQHYFSDKPYNPINFFIGVLEVFGEFTRILSLSLRLFLNTAVGEILVAVFTSMILAHGRTPLAVIPIILFEVLVAGIQAYVFTILSATYLGLAIAHSDDSHHDDHQSISASSEVDSEAMIDGRDN